MTEESEVKARWAGYFERLYQADPPAVELDVRDVTITVADSPINCVSTNEGGPQLIGGSVTGIVTSLTSNSTAGGSAWYNHSK